MSYLAAMDTVLFGRAYLKDEVVDITAWNRKQLQQQLSTGLVRQSSFDLSPVVPNVGDVLAWDGSQWAPWNGTVWTT